jgi:parallel beta-helix repeat protein
VSRTWELLGLALLGAALTAGCGQESPQESAPQLGLRPPPRAACDLYAATNGSDSAAGSRVQPVRTAQRLVKALHSGQTGCFRAGTYRFAELDITKPNLDLAARGDGAVTLGGTIQVKPGGAGLRIEGMKLVGAGGTSDIGPRIYADHVLLRDNEITNDHTDICVSVSAYYSNPPPRGVRIEGNRIHDCGALPSTNMDHGIYVAEAVGTVIRGNWIYNNADRGVQLYPSAQHTTVTANVIDGNGQGVVLGGTGGVTSNNNLIQGNVIANSRDGLNVYSGRPGPGSSGNVVRNNCVWTGDGDASGIEAPSRNFTAHGNTVVDPQYSDPAGGDYTLSPESECPLAGRSPFSRSD